MQHIDRPAQIQALAKPAGARGPRVDAQALRIVMRAQRAGRIFRDRGRRRQRGQRATVWSPEAEASIGQTRDLEALLVHGAVMPGTEQREIRERGGATVRPMTKVMPLREADVASREAATLVPMMERSPQHRGNPPGFGADLHHASLL